MSAITGPIAPFSNVPIAPTNFQPRRFVITAITLGATTTVTTSEDHDYVIGQQIRLLIPPTFGSRQLNQKTAYVLSIPSSTQVELDIDSRNGDAFINHSAFTKAQIVAIGDINMGYISTSGSVVSDISIPGAFENISN